LKYGDEYLDGMEPEFLRKAVDWAKTLIWQEDDGALIDDHVHCEVCTRPLRKDSSHRIYRTDTNYVCHKCHELFMG